MSETVREPGYKPTLGEGDPRAAGSGRKSTSSYWHRKTGSEPQIF